MIILEVLKRGGKVVVRKLQNLYRAENNFLKAMVSWLIGGLSALICGGLAVWLFIPYVYEQRAGFEIGGEWLAVLSITAAGFGFGKCFLIEDRTSMFCCERRVSMSERTNKRREDMPLPAPNAEGNVWPKQVCPAFIPRGGIDGIRQCWFCCHADFHLNQPQALEVGICYWPKKILR